MTVRVGRRGRCRRTGQEGRTSSRRGRISLGRFSVNPSTGTEDTRLFPSSLSFCRTSLALFCADSAVPAVSTFVSSLHLHLLITDYLFFSLIFSCMSDLDLCVLIMAIKPK